MVGPGIQGGDSGVGVMEPDLHMRRLDSGSAGMGLEGFRLRAYNRYVPEVDSKRPEPLLHGDVFGDSFLMS